MTLFVRARSDKLPRIDKASPMKKWCPLILQRSWPSCCVVNLCFLLPFDVGRHKEWYGVSCSSKFFARPKYKALYEYACWTYRTREDFTTAFYSALHFVTHQIFPLTVNGNSIPGSTITTVQKLLTKYKAKQAQVHYRTCTYLFEGCYPAYVGLYNLCMTSRTITTRWVFRKQNRQKFIWIPGKVNVQGHNIINFSAVI